MNNRVVGFDFGPRTIGVATGNFTTRTSQALRAIPARRDTPDWQSLLTLVAEWRPGRLLVGLPLGLNDDETPMSKKARQFAEQLGKQTGLPVEMVDERLTSAAADALLRDSAVAGKAHQRQIADRRDSLAAELIIQTYFNDNRSNPGNPPGSTPD